MGTYILTEEEKAFFRLMMKDVRPLGEKTTPLTYKTLDNTPSMKPEPILVSSFYLSDYYTEEVQADTSLFFCAGSLSKKRFRALKQGAIPYQAKLDLHGLTATVAKENLIHFIHDQHRLMHRCILIIHGKGNKLKNQLPVLKNLVNRWLPQFPHVFAFHSAIARDGGNGAVYVLLKRKEII